MSKLKRNTRRFHRRRRNGTQRQRIGSNSFVKESNIAATLVGASAFTQGAELEDNQTNPQSLEFNMFGGKRNPSCGNDIADHILCFLELLNTIKIYHWSTLSYPTHKATDELHTKLSALVDSFIEIYIGHCSRQRRLGVTAGVPVFRFKTAKTACISFCECKSLDAFCKVLDDNIVHLEGLTKKLDGYTDLVNIRDEMVGALAQALYLLRLK
jgi:hypothetical protein